MKDKVAKAAYDKVRRARLRHDTRPTQCRVCQSPLRQARTSVRYFCSDRCKLADFYVRHPSRPETREPFPLPYVGDSIFQQAREAANISGGYGGAGTGLTHDQIDWGQHDILGEAVLAILEGRDPKAAVSAHRRIEGIHEAHRAFGVEDVGTDGRRIIAQRSHEAA